MADFQTLDLARVLGAAEQIKGAQRQSITDQLQQKYLGQRIAAGEQDQQMQVAQQQMQIDAVKAKQAYLQLDYADRSGNPKQYLLSQPGFRENWESKGVPVSQMDDASFKQFVGSLKGQLGAAAGIAPTPRYEEVQGPNGAILQKDPATGELKQVVAPQRPTEMTPYQTESLKLQRENAAATRAQADATRQTAATTANFTRADKLRDEFNAQSKDFVTVGDAYSKVQSAAQDPSAAGDLALIFSYMKILDPGSVVREQEFANAQNAGGVPDRIRSAWNRALNGERLSPSQRADFLNQAKKTYTAQENRSKVVTNRYTKLATDLGVDPKYVVSNLGVQEPQAEPAGNAPVKVQSPDEAMKLPPGTVFITPDGRRKVR